MKVLKVLNIWEREMRAKWIFLKAPHSHLFTPTGSSSRNWARHVNLQAPGSAGGKKNDKAQPCL